VPRRFEFRRKLMKIRRLSKSGVQVGPKITLAVASDIALDKLVASDANVRRIKAGVSVEHLAEDIGLDPTVVSRARSSIN
jgi:hypothetical protein